MNTSQHNAKKPQNLWQQYQQMAKGLPNKKYLTSATMLGSAFLSAIPIADAAIVYVDVSGSNIQAYQTAIGQTSAVLDIFNLGDASDLLIRAKVFYSSNYTTTSNQLVLRNLDDSAIKVSTNANFIKALSAGATISNPNLNLVPNFGIVCEYAGNGEGFENKTNFEGYIGLQFEGKNMWIKVRVTTAFNEQRKIKILEYAYETTGAAILAGQGESLPIELTSFSVSHKQGQNILLNWQTASELDNAGFEVERSTDGKNFQSLTFMEGNGTSQEIKKYYFEDKNFRLGQTYYYRLRQIDYNGQFEYSDVVSLTVAHESMHIGEFYPNPITNGRPSLDLQIEEDGNVSVTIFSTSGQEMLQLNRTVTAGHNTMQLDATSLAPGTYFAKIEQGAQRVYRKLIVQ